MVKFRFQDLRIWQSAIAISDELFNIADEVILICFVDKLQNFRNR